MPPALSSTSSTPQAQNHPHNLPQFSSPGYKFSPAASIGSAQSGRSIFEGSWTGRSGDSSAATSVASSVAFANLEPHGSFTSGPPTVVIQQLSTQTVPELAAHAGAGAFPCAAALRPPVLSDATPLVSTPVPVEQRQHPRRTARRAVPQGISAAVPSGDSCAPRAPSPPAVPTLQRQADRKVNFVENLVDSAAQIVETIWHPPRNKPAPPPKEGVLPLRTFIQETLRRSRTSYSTLQVALYYLIVIRPHLPGQECDIAGLEDKALDIVKAKQCGRRMFLAALILASKYLQDRNYSARAWSKISGLPTNEINVNEMAFLDAVDWKLHISEVVFQRWTDLVLRYTSAPSPSPVSPTRTSPWSTDETRKIEWCELVLHLSPDLHEVDAILRPSLLKRSATLTPTLQPPPPPSLKRAATTAPKSIPSMSSISSLLNPSLPAPTRPEPSRPRATVHRKSTLANAVAQSPGMITLSYPSPKVVPMPSPRQEAAWALGLLRGSTTPSPGMGGRKRSAPGSTGVTPRLRGLLGSPVVEGERKRRCGWGEFGVGAEGVAQGVR